jgi:hypothetical protein
MGVPITGHLNVSTRPLTARRGDANGSVNGLRTRNAARAGGDAAESLLPAEAGKQPGLNTTA